MSNWIEHDGKGMPVDGETLVHVRFPDGYEDTVSTEGEALQPSPANYWSTSWSWTNTTPLNVEIIAYRVHTPASEVAA